MEKIKNNYMESKLILVISFLSVFMLITSFVNAQDIEDEIIIHRGAKDGFLGVKVQKIPKLQKEKLGVRFGVQVAEVVKNSSAEKNGIHKGDVLQFFDGKKIRLPNDLIFALGKRKSGDSVGIKFITHLYHCILRNTYI